MTNSKLALLLLLTGAGVLLGCDSSDGSTNTNTNSVSATSGPDDALRKKTCYLGLAPAGTSYTGYACSGISQDSSVSGIGPNSWDDVRMSLQLSLNAEPAIGALDIATLTVSIPNADGSKLIWNAVLDSCTAKAVSSATDEFMGWIYYRIDIACAAPAVPAADNPRAPLELGQFSIVTFFEA